MPSDEAKEPAAPSRVDIQKLSVGEALKALPFAWLLSLCGALVAGTATLTFTLTSLLNAQEVRYWEREAQAKERIAATLHRAMENGACIKSDAVARQAEARGFVAGLDVARRAAQKLYKAMNTGDGGLRGVGIESKFTEGFNLGLFRGDERLIDLITDVNLAALRFNDALGPAWGIPAFLEQVRKATPSQPVETEERDVARAERANAEFLRSIEDARAYVQAKYLLLDDVTD